jgi:hypothetical protein
MDLGLQVQPVQARPEQQGDENGQKKIRVVSIIIEWVTLINIIHSNS